MGDRANVVLKDQGQAIYLYTHWTGTELPETLRQALIKGESRWGDTSYLGRVIFSTMTRGYEDQVTGFGIGVGPDDNSYPYLVVDDSAGVVEVHDGGGTPRRADGTWGTPVATFTFREYVAVPRDWRNVTAKEPATT